METSGGGSPQRAGGKTVPSIVWPRAIVAFPEGSTAARYVAAYRRWLGIDPYPRASSRRPKATEDDLDMSRDIDLIALAVKGNAISCRIPGTERTLTLRPSGSVEVVPGEMHHRITDGRSGGTHAIPTLPAQSPPPVSTYRALGLTPLETHRTGNVGSERALLGRAW